MLRVIAAASAWFLAVAAPAYAQNYPTSPVRVIVPFGAGSNTDIVARLIGGRLADALGQAVVIENRPGGGAVIGTTAAAQADPDGYTLLMITNAQTANETLIPNKGYVLLRDFAPVASIDYSDYALVINPQVPANTLAEFIQLAKSRPGKMNYSSIGPGTSPHLAAELFKSVAGVDIVHIPYSNTGTARTDLIAGRVDMQFDATPTILPALAARQVRVLAVAGNVRSAAMPDVPTFAEAGLPEFQAAFWIGLLAPKKTPVAIVNRLNTEVNKILARKDVIDLWAQQGTFAAPMTPEEFGSFLEKDIFKWANVIKVAGIKLQ